MAILGRSRRRRRRTILVLLGVLLLAIGVGIHLVDRVMRPVLVTIARNQVQGRGIILLSEVVLEEAVEPFHYSDLIHVETTTDGYVSYMMPNTMRISRLVARVNQQTQERINELRDEDFGIPIGQLSGLSILANVGPRLPVDVLPVGTAQVTIEEDFEGAGVNHVRHTIYMVATCSLTIAVPLIQERVEVTVRLPVAEAIIVGPVPEMYLNLGILPGASAP